MSKPDNEKSKLSDERRKILEELSLSDAILPRGIDPNTPLKETRCKFDEGIRYEVALYVLGERKQPMIMAIQNEKEKENPSEKFIAYCESRLDALRDLQDELSPEEVELINQILDPEAEFKII